MTEAHERRSSSGEIGLSPLMSQTTEDKAMISTQKIAKALRAGGRSVVTGVPSSKDMSNFWLIDGKVLNVQTRSILGLGCFTHPDYEATKAALVAEAKALLDAASIPYAQSLTPDQLFLNGYRPASYTPAEMKRWEMANGLS